MNFIGGTNKFFKTISLQLFNHNWRPPVYDISSLKLFKNVFELYQIEVKIMLQLQLFTKKVLYFTFCSFTMVPHLVTGNNKRLCQSFRRTAFVVIFNTVSIFFQNYQFLLKTLEFNKKNVHFTDFQKVFSSRFHKYTFFFYINVAA